jgi:hypothetical protein
MEPKNRKNKKMAGVRNLIKKKAYSFLLPAGQSCDIIAAASSSLQ